MTYFEVANARRGFRWAGKTIDFIPCNTPLGLVGVYRCESDKEASMLRGQGHRGVTEITDAQYRARSVQASALQIDRKYELIEAHSDEVQRSSFTVPSFTEQTPWENGLFTFPLGLDITAHYNCALAEDKKGVRWLFTRRHRFFGGNQNLSDIAIFKVRPNMTLEFYGIPALPNRYPGEQFEDPRAMIGSDGTCYLSLATWIQGELSYSIRQSICKLTPDFRKLQVLAEPEHGGNTSIPRATHRHEKNWCWFEQAKGDWNFVYSINPHVVVKVNSSWKPEKVHFDGKKDLPWEFGEPRGGTPPVKVGSEYVCFFHSALPWTQRKRRYYMGAYAFEAEPPFRLTRMTPKPILIGSELDFRIMDSPLVIFPNGALLEDRKWTVVFGMNDEHCGWIKIPHADLNKLMKKV